MSVRYGAARLEVPSGFENILWLISQEVMRIHPENTVMFISAFLEDLLAIREKTGLDPITTSGILGQVQAEYAKLQDSKIMGSNPSNGTQVDETKGKTTSGVSP